jgi:glycosyltransferase involved in cell wall biosynthesis
LHHRHVPRLDRGCGASRPTHPHRRDRGADAGRRNRAALPRRCRIAEILAAGRLVGQKNFLLALQAFARLDRPQARLTILGEGPERPALMAGIERLGLQGRCTLPGLVPDIRPWLDRSRFFLLSSDYEGFPAVVVESLAAGRAVVATASSPVLGELITSRETGRIVPRGDARALSEAMALLLDSPPADPALLAQNAARHRMAPVAARYLALFDEKTGP